MVDMRIFIDIGRNSREIFALNLLLKVGSRILTYEGGRIDSF